MKATEDLMNGVLGISKHPYTAFFILLVALFGFRNNMR